MTGKSRRTEVRVLNPRSLGTMETSHDHSDPATGVGTSREYWPNSKHPQDRDLHGFYRRGLETGEIPVLSLNMARFKFLDAAGRYA